MDYPSDIKNTILCTHLGCMDGAACVILFRHAGGLPENVRLVTAGGLEKFLNQELDKLGDKFVIFADVGVTSPEAADVLEKRGNCVLIDHHKTSLHMKGRPWARIDAEGNGGSACGSELFRQYLAEMFPVFEINDAIKVFTRTVDDFDRWQRKNPVSEDLSIFMAFVGQKDFIERFIDVRDRWNIFKDRPFTPAEEEIVATLKKRADENISHAISKVIIRDVHWGGNTVKVGYLVSSEPNTSKMLDTLLVQYPELEVACQVMVDKNSVSLRSRNGYDVSEMAKYFGGGGHRAASGHPLPQNLIQEILDEIHGA